MIPKLVTDTEKLNVIKVRKKCDKTNNQPLTVKIVLDLRISLREGRINSSLLKIH